MTWYFSHAADPGGRSDQQDRVALYPLAASGQYLLVLADGMGGHEDGAAAAQQVVDTAADYAAAPDCGHPVALLESFCLDAHLYVARIGYGEGTERVGPPPGSTCVALVAGDGEAYWTHVGDSRLNLVRNGRVLRQTQDHSLRELQTADGLVQRSVLYMCLGGSKTPQPSVDFIAIEPGDLVILSSDGYWEQVAVEETIARIGQQPVEAGTAAALVDLARRRGGAGADNISLAIAQWRVPPSQNFLYRLAARLRRAR